jgi:hypothetical protein
MMKISITKLFFSLVFLLLSVIVFSQGIVEVPLSCNPVLIKKYNELKNKSFNKAPSITDTISLDPLKGILDDFSLDNSYPDTSIWLDNYVFINREYAKAPITLGVATFDGLNSTGYPYAFDQAHGLATSDLADYLTSKPIDLNFLPSDSVYLSFYYQPQGRGDSPGPHDSLVLDFKGPGNSAWKHIWAKKGTSLPVNDSSWKRVMIPITDTSFLKKGFQFQFHNWATLSCNCDHWNIDYVYLNRFRNNHDTIFDDVSFVYNTPSLLNTYTEVPWRHYNTGMMKSNYATTIRNNNFNNIPPNFGAENCSFFYNIYDNTGTLVNTYTGGAKVLLPFVPNGYVNEPLFTSPTLAPYVIPAFSSSVNSIQRYSIECYLKTSANDKNNMNDTVRHVQGFAYNYSYDDGTAESEVGLNVLDSKMSVKYTSSIADTLRYIDIYFNPYVTNPTSYAFVMKVWADAGGVPGTELFSNDAILFPYFIQTNYNQFIRYPLSTPLYLNAGSFYIGFQQKTADYIYVGLDKNINNQNKIFYNTGASWQTFPFTGSLMMHPVFGNANDFVGIEDYSAKEKEFSFYPNPTNEKLYIRSNSDNHSKKISYSVFDLYGRTILEATSVMPEFIDVSAIAEGVYFVRIVDGAAIITNKFVKIK